MLDETLRTTNPNVFAAGDVTGAPQFVYVPPPRGTLAAQNAISDANGTLDHAALPRVTFTTPNIAAVGLTDEQSEAAGYECECRSSSCVTCQGRESTSIPGGSSRSSPSRGPGRCSASTRSATTPGT